MNIESSFGQLVKNRRRELGLTQDELARRVGCAPVTLRKIEYDDLRPSVQIAERLAMALNIALEERAAFVRLARAERAPEPMTPTPAPAPEEIGTVDLTGRAIRGYALGERIGNGGMGAVYRATQPHVEREVAIKIILPQYANHPDFIRRFEAEAQLVARLEHPHIVPLYDYWREPGSAYLIMRLLRGGSVRGLLEKGALPIEHTARLVEQIGSALNVAHRAGVIHRDLKPGNVLLDEDGNAYLADFGIAKNLSNPNLEDVTQADAIIGSPAYISPEQIRSEFVRPQTDIYCLGVMLYELLTGTVPFAGPTPIEVMHQHLSAPLPPLAANRSGLPAALDAVIEHATAKDPLERYENVEELLRDLRKAIGRVGVGELESGELKPILQPSTPPILTPDDNPYKGLRAFGEGDAADFFGREALTQQLLVRIGEGGDLARFLAVVGPSGSGKSSVVRAGLAPALKRGALPGSDQWFIVEMMPGPHPLEELEAALLRVAVTPAVATLHATSLLAQLKEDKRGLLRAVRRCLPDDPNVELVLVIDQFEEVFTLVHDEATRAHFLDSLVTAALDERSRVRVLVTLRADFTDRPLNYVDFGELLRQRSEFILPMTPEELERAIVGPAELVGLQLEPGLVATILRDVGDQPGALPLLQYALTELFEKRENRTLTKAAYDSIGGVLGALGRRAEEVFTSLDDAGQAAARQLFLRLVTLGEGVEDTRRRVLRAELEGLTTKSTKAVTKNTKKENLGGLGESLRVLSGLIDVFGKHRLLSFDRDPVTRGPTVEVAHEALLREWGRLREWLAESRADVRLQRQLAQAANEWQTANREGSYLLTGAKLEQFEGWALTTTVALTADERAFLEAGLAERDRRALEERVRQRRELDDAKRIAEAARKLAETERARADEQVQYVTRVRTRNRAIAIAGAIALVLAVLAGLFGLQAGQSATAALNSASTAQAESLNRATQQALAENERNRADAQAQAAINAQATAQAEAQSRATAEALAVQKGEEAQQQSLIVSVRELAGVANLNLNLDPERSILLALQAVALTDNAGLPPLLEAQDALHRAVQASRVQFTLRGHTAGLIGLAYSPDGTRLVTFADDNSLKIWDTATGTELTSISSGQMSQRVYRRPSFSPDGKRVAAGGSHLAKVWDVASGEELLTLSGHTDEVKTVIFSPDGKRIATASWDYTAKIWDAVTGQELLTLTGQNEPVNDVAFSPDGAYLATAGGGFPPSEDSSAIVWDAVSGAQLFTLPAPEGVASIAFSPDGKKLATGSGNAIWSLWDISTGQRLYTAFGHASNVNDIYFDPTSTRIVTADEDGTAKVWDAATGRELLTLWGHASGVVGAAFSPDGVHVATAGNDGTARIWDVSPAGGREWFNLLGHNHLVLAAAYSPNGKYIATGSVDFTAKIWDAETGKVLQTLSSGDNAIPAVYFSPDSARLIAVSGTSFQDEGLSAVAIWDVATGEQLLTFSGRFGGDAALSPDGKTLATTMIDGVIKIWDITTGEEGLTLPGGESRFQALAYSPDGKHLAVASYDSGMVRIWDAGTGQLILTLDNGDTVNIVTYSHDGKLIATSSDDASLKIWDAATGEQLSTLIGHTGATTGLAFSPDDQYLASASVDSTVKIWDVADNFTSQPLTLYGHINSVFSVAFSPDGSRLVSASRDRTARVYAFKIEDLVALAQSRLTRTLTTEECQKYLHVDTCPAP